MDIEIWNCCRMCLNVQSLYPIFQSSDYHEKYTDVIFTTTGVKVEMNDSLPQLICNFCINFINESVKFRKKCEETNAQLLNCLDNKEYPLVKNETSQIIKLENEKCNFIDITHLLTDVDNDFQDYDDNITLDTLQMNKITNNFTKQDDDAKNEISKYETKDSIIDNDKIVKKTDSGKPKRKRRSKKENKQKETKDKIKGERAREHVECEYCHKILTSRLSLRNHYKIHTGFDVVCEHCGKKFITKRLLLMHCRAKHGYEKTDKCSYCDYKASNAEQVKIHERLHTGEKPYVCAECGTGFHRKSSYLQHVAIHLPEKTVQCDQCPARFKSVTLMRIHKSRHKTPVYTFQCRVCEGTFARRRNVARHLQRVHGLTPDHNHIRRRHIA